MGRAQKIITFPGNNQRLYLWKASAAHRPFPGVELHVDAEGVDSKHFLEHTRTLEKLKITLTRNRDLRLLISPRSDDNNNNEEVCECDNDDFANTYKVLPVVLGPTHIKLRVRFYNSKSSTIRWAETAILKDQFAKNKVLKVDLKESMKMDGQLAIYYELDHDKKFIAINMVKLEVYDYKKGLNFRMDSKNMTF